MTRNSKRIRRDGEGSSSNPPPPPPPQAPASPSDQSQPSSPPVPRFPWPREEGIPIYSERQWSAKVLTEFEKPEYINRELSDDWGDYETLLYNGWLKVEIQPTRFKDKKLLEDMSMGWAMTSLVNDMGLGFMTDLDCDLYPDLVRQFMASVRVDMRRSMLGMLRKAHCLSLLGAFVIASLFQIFVLSMVFVQMVQQLPCLLLLIRPRSSGPFSPSGHIMLVLAIQISDILRCVIWFVL